MSHNPDDPKTLTVAYKAYTEIDLQALADEHNFKTEDIACVSVRWNDLTIELKDGREVNAEISIDDVTDYKYPEYIHAGDGEGATITADNNDSLRLDESTGESLHANTAFIAMIEAYLTLHPSTRFTINEGFLYDGDRKIILTALSALLYCGVIRQESLTADR